MVLQGVLKLLMFGGGGRMLLMGHACTANEGCVFQCSLGVYIYDYASNNDCID